METINIIKIANQLYKIQFNKTTDLINIIITHTITKTSYTVAIDSSQVESITTKGGFIRTLDQFYVYLNAGAKNEENSKFKLTGKLNNDDSIIILALTVSLGLLEDECVLYTFELQKIQKEIITRMEEMMIDFCETYKPIDDGIISKIKLDLNDMMNNMESKINNITDECKTIVNKHNVDCGILDQKINNITNECKTIINKHNIDYGTINQQIINRFAETNTNISNICNEITTFKTTIQLLQNEINNLKKCQF